MIAVDAAGQPLIIEADFVVGADGSHSVARSTASETGGYFREYPFAWFGILCEASPSADELIYSNSPEGFVLISQRSPSVQRMYFQCHPSTDPHSFSEEQLWIELQKRVPGTTLVEGPIFQRDVLRFRSFVAHELRRGRVALIGYAAHTVPPTGAKGMNLAVADVVVLERALRALLLDQDERLLDGFAETALHRTWKAQHFSWWMTNMLHVTDDASEFDRLRQIGELRSVVDSEAGSTYLAERTPDGRSKVDDDNWKLMPVFGRQKSRRRDAALRLANLNTRAKDLHLPDSSCGADLHDTGVSWVCSKCGRTLLYTFI